MAIVILAGGRGAACCLLRRCAAQAHLSRDVRPVASEVGLRCLLPQMDGRNYLLTDNCLESSGSHVRDVKLRAITVQCRCVDASMILRLHPATHGGLGTGAAPWDQRATCTVLCVPTPGRSASRHVRHICDVLYVREARCFVQSAAACSGYGERMRSLSYSVIPAHALPCKWRAGVRGVYNCTRAMSHASPQRGRLLRCTRMMLRCRMCSTSTTGFAVDAG